MSAVEEYLTVSECPLGQGMSAPAETELGRKLRELRGAYLASGGQLLTREEFRQELAEMRGYADETDAQ